MEAGLVPVCEVLATWCPQGWRANKELFEDAGHERRQRLLCNPNYSNVAPALKTLNEQLALLQRLNIQGPGHTEQVDAGYVERMTGISDAMSDLVLTTYAVFLIVEKLPKIACGELRKAEVSKFNAKVGGRAHALPAVLDEHLKAFVSAS